MNRRVWAVKAAGKVVLLLLWTLLLLPAQMAALGLRSSMAKRIPVLYHRVNCRIVGITVAVTGTPSPVAPTLIVANHTSYLDIIVLSALKPVSFVAKHEVASWPLFGLLAKLQRSVFVVRRAARSAAHRDDIAERLAEGDDLVLFPEGTSNDGNRVLRFNSTFFAVADQDIEGKPLTVQPVSIAYNALGNLPMRRSMRPYFAWYGDMDLPSHLWAALTMAPFGVTVVFHPPVTRESFGSRKAMALHCHRVVADGVAAALTGREMAPAELRGAA